MRLCPGHLSRGLKERGAWAGPRPARVLPAGVCLSSQPPGVPRWASLALLTSPLCSWLQVVFGKKLPAFATIPIHQLQHEKKYDIYFADGKVFALYR